MDVLARLRERFWFLPAVLCVVAFLLAEALVRLDMALGAYELPSWIGIILTRVGESGSRDILNAIASSSLAVAGTTFSITMAVLALTSSSYGPRLVRNFMVDKGNQLVLGVFVGTFLYSLLVLRSIRVIGDPGSQQGDVFIPHLAVNVAVLLAVLNIGVLVYFIHHISSSIQIWTLAKEVRADLRTTVTRLYPEGLGSADTARDRDREEPAPSDDGAPVTAGRSGYVQYIEEKDLLKAAREHDVLVAMRVVPGRYVLDDTVIATVHPANRAGVRLQGALRSAVAVANARSPQQDLEFAVQQLTEMAVRALSPGTNDPYTAVNALDDLSSGLSMLVARRRPSPARYDEDGRFRVHAPSSDSVDLLASVLDGVRWYGASHPLVMHRALDLATTVGEHARDGAVRAELLREVDLLVDAFRSAGHHEHDVAAFERRAQRVARALASARG